MMIGYFLLLGAFGFTLSVMLYLGVREWLQARDASPLPIAVDYLRLENFFGLSFRKRIEQWLREAQPVESTGLGEPVVGALERENGERLLLLRGGKYGGERECDEVVFSEGDLQITAGAVFRRELYSRGSVSVEKGCQLQAIAADGEIFLGPRTTVARWVDARGHVRIGESCVINSRVSSNTAVEFGRGCSVQSLYAPLVYTGGYSTENTPCSGSDDAGQAPSASALAEAVQLSAETLLMNGDLRLPDASRIDSNLVVLGRLTAGANCVFAGDVKAAAVQLGCRNSVLGNLAAEGAIQVGRDASIGRSVVAEGDIHLAAGTRVGTPAAPSAVISGGYVRLEQNIAVCGKISGRAVLT